MLVSALENLLNRGLPRSVRARALCAELEGRRLAVEAPGLGRVLIGSSGAALTVRRGEEPAEASLSGGPLSLGILGIGLSHEPIRSGAVQVHGDAELAEKFQQLLRLLRPDPEEELAGLLGDVPAHTSASSRAARSAGVAAPPRPCGGTWAITWPMNGATW